MVLQNVFSPKFVSCVCAAAAAAAAAGCLPQSDRPKLSPAGLRMKADALLLLCFSPLSPRRLV